MRKPEKPYPPHDWDFGMSDFSNDYDEIDIYADRIWLMDDDREDEYYDGNERMKKPAVRFGHELTLQHLLDLIPEGVSPKDIHVHWDTPRMLEHFDVKFVYYKPADMEARKAAYKKAMDKHKKKLEKYREDEKKYNELNRAKKIKDLELELKSLKNE